MKKFGTAIILAGGKSKRMGFDKKLLQINEKKLIQSLSEKLLKEFDEVIIVTEYNDEIKNKGPLGGIHGGLKLAKSEYVYFIACDMPILNFKYINFLKHTLKDLKRDAIVTKQGEFIEPFNSFYNKRLICEIEKYLELGSLSIQKFLNNMNCLYIDEKIARRYSSSWDMFLNLNTKDDLLYYKKYIGE